MAAGTFTVVCAWCSATMQAGASGAPVTLSICPSCADWPCTNPHAALDGPGVPGDDYFVLPPRLTPDGAIARH